MKKMICVMLALAMVFCNISVCYAEERLSAVDGINTELYVARTTKYFSMGVKAQGTSYVTEVLSLDAGETVRINATYSPTSASIYIGLVDANGKFYYACATNGQLDITISIQKRGDYRLAVVNNSTKPVSISGYVYC